VYLTDGPAWITDNALYPKDTYQLFVELFLACSLKAVRLNEVKNKNDLPLVTQAILAAVKIAWPAIEEQRAIATALSDIDPMYRNSSEGKVYELGFMASDTGSTSNNQGKLLRGKNRDLRKDAFHVGGRTAVNEITPYRIGVEWSGPHASLRLGRGKSI
jgi:hypothetical protein